MQAEILHVFVRFLSTAVDDTRNFTGKKFIVSLYPYFSWQGIDIGLLHIPDDLDTFPVKMIKKAGQLQCRTVHIWMA